MEEYKKVCSDLMYSDYYKRTIEYIKEGLEEKVDKEEHRDVTEKEVYDYMHKIIQYVQNDRREEGEEEMTTPLCRAVELGNIEEVKSLLDEGMDIDERDESNRTPLHIAVSNNFEDIVRLLVSRGANVNRSKGFMCDYPIHAAVKNRNSLIAKILLDAGADVNTKSFDFETPLHISICKDDIEMFNLLLKYKPDLTQTDDCGNTPLHILVELCDYRDEDMVVQLLKHGADVNLKNINGQTPLDIYKRDLEDGIITHPHPTLVKLLIKSPSTVDG